MMCKIGSLSSLYSFYENGNERSDRAGVTLCHKDVMMTFYPVCTLHRGGKWMEAIHWHSPCERERFTQLWPAANHSSHNALMYVNLASKWKGKHYALHNSTASYFPHHHPNYGYLHLNIHAFTSTIKVFFFGNKNSIWHTVDLGGLYVSLNHARFFLVVSKSIIRQGCVVVMETSSSLFLSLCVIAATPAWEKINVLMCYCICARLTIHLSY